MNGAIQTALVIVLGLVACVIFLKTITKFAKLTFGLIILSLMVILVIYVIEVYFKIPLGILSKIPFSI